MVKTNKTDQIVTAAKAAGGTGATIIPARGTGIAFVIDVEQAVGFESQLEHFRRAAETHG